MAREFLIDGYNLMHQAGYARVNYRPGELERARLRLLGRLSRCLTGDERGRTTVVFDARDARDATRSQLFHQDMRVLFSPPGQDADDMIEDLLSVAADPRQLVLVSSDHRLQRAARARRALPIDSDRFLDELDLRQSRRESEPEETDDAESATDDPRSVTSRAQLEAWMAEFGEIDLAELTRGLPPASPLPPTAESGPIESPPAIAEPPTPPGPTEPTSHLDSDELRFWEERIAELFRDGNPGKSPPET